MIVVLRTSTISNISGQEGKITKMTDSKEQAAAADAGQQPRRSSIFDRFKSKSHGVSGDAGSDTASTHSRIPLIGRRTSAEKAEKEAKKKEKRESMSERGAFSIVVGEDGVARAVENKDWPPGVKYETSSQMKQLQGKLGPFYEGGGSSVPGGETLGNRGPDPDWIPGLSEAEREKLRKDQSGKYGKWFLLLHSRQLLTPPSLLNVSLQHPSNVCVFDDFRGRKPGTRIKVFDLRDLFFHNMNSSFAHYEFDMLSNQHKLPHDMQCLTYHAFWCQATECEMHMYHQLELVRYRPRDLERVAEQFVAHEDELVVGKT